MKRAGSTSIDLRQLPPGAIRKRERPEREGPEPNPIELPGSIPVQRAAPAGGPSAPAPGPSANFAGLDFNNWGAGHPPDTNGDVGPTYFIETVNTSIGIYNKSTGVRVAAFTFDTFMSQGNFGNLCDTDNFGDPVVLYDTFEDRWVISDFAFQLDAGQNVVNPPGNFQCIAVSKTGDPVAGGWNFYSINTTGGLGDYPKFGVWPDGIYMSVNMFDYAASGSFQNVRLYAFNKAQMYAGAPGVQVVSFDAPADEFTLLPSNARLQTGTPPAGSPNYFAVVWNFLNVVSVYKFHVDWNSISTSTLTGPFTSLTATSWSQFSGANGDVPSPANALDTLYPRLMVQNQYSNIGGVESLWDSHTVGASGATSAQAGVRYYQVKVTGGTIEANATQAFTFSPDATVHRFMPSVEVDRAGNMAIGYSASNASLNPAIRYAGRLAGDAANAITQTETSLIEGTGSQNSTNRWGDYSSMSLDPDGCRFWMSNEYYAVTGGNWQTRIGAFKYPACTPVSTGSVQGTVTATASGAPIAGATVSLGSRNTTTDAGGAYTFSAIPTGTYPSLSAAAAGYATGTVSNVVVSDGSATTKDFSLAAAPASACPVDTTQADFQLGVPTAVDLTTAPGSVTLVNTPTINQQNTTLGGFGVAINSTAWGGQTFTPSASGKLTQADINLFCSSCTGTTPNLTLSLRATSAGLPTGADLASGTITGFSSGSSGYYSVVFASGPTLNAGTQYALVIRPVSNPSAGTYALTRSGTQTQGADVYAGGARVSSTTSGTSWSIPNTGSAQTDTGFKVYLSTGFAASGDLVSSTKDANPASGLSVAWTTLSWGGATPANTSLRFQAAGSNSSFGPFNFVGPDGTAATFYTTTGASLSQFAGKRYLQYRAFLATTNGGVTPVLDDATVCFSNTSGSTADLSVTNSDGVATASPGGSVTYTITAANAGPSAALASNVVDNFPGTLTCSWTCAASSGSTCTASGSGNINDSVNLPNGGSVTYTATCNISAAATGSLLNTATVTAPAGVTDPSSANNSASDTDTLSPSANLGITNTDGVTTATPGGSVNYTITASNPGPSNAPSSTVADTFPASLTCSWTCVGAGGGTCTASGSGNINNTVNLPSGGSVTYTASCTIGAGATGSLVNTATVAPPGSVTDPTPANNSATDTDTLSPSANLGITNTDGVTTATAGGSV
ncbi:MAG TPA: carboxypeptidase regulatory-like domain-containing protein, partial [Rhodanobacteraceae bacterium]|nr:carboxypeptidase regulatory-like domain-containing protein [Rhodanobacteraceae bacterium]